MQQLGTNHVVCNWVRNCTFSRMQKSQKRLAHALHCHWLHQYDSKFCPYFNESSAVNIYDLFAVKPF